MPIFFMFTITLIHYILRDRIFALYDLIFKKKKNLLMFMEKTVLSISMKIIGWNYGEK